MSDSPTPSAGTFRWLTIGVILFSIYGSFVPFRFHARSLNDAVHGFQWALESRFWIQSRSDFVANVILGLPLGFCLLAAARLDKPFSAAKSLLAGIVLWPWCIAFAAVIEFGQLFFHERTSSSSDIVAQAIGSATGMMIWVAFGERLVRLFRRVWQGDRIGGTAGRITLAYLALLALVQWLPLDLTLSPADLWHKYTAGKFVLIPFEELSTHGLDAKLPGWLELCGLYSIAGMLAAGIVRSPWNTITKWYAVALRGFLLAILFETGQILVVSRSTSMTDVLLGGVSVLIGWFLVRAILPKPGAGISRDLGLILGQAWLAFLLAASWFPYDFNRLIMADQFEQLNWIPFAAAYEKNYLSSLEEAVSKTLLFAPFGAIVAAVGVRRVVKTRPAILIGLLAAAVIEIGQLALTRVASPTDLIFGAFGGWLGAATALRLRAYGFGTLPPPPKNPVRFKVT